jgi:hypothetical protein
MLSTTNKRCRSNTFAAKDNLIQLEQKNNKIKENETKIVERRFFYL